MMSPYDDDYVSRIEVQEMIDAAIRKHDVEPVQVTFAQRSGAVAALVLEGIKVIFNLENSDI